MFILMRCECVYAFTYSVLRLNNLRKRKVSSFSFPLYRRRRRRPRSLTDLVTRQRFRFSVHAARK